MIATAKTPAAAKTVWVIDNAGQLFETAASEADFWESVAGTVYEEYLPALLAWAKHLGTHSST